MILHKTILVLEDNLRVVSKLLDRLYSLEGDQPYELSVVVMTNYQQVQELLNKNVSFSPDIILLDRDDKLGESFHVLDLERFGPEKIIAISSVPEFNDRLKKRGVKRVVLKNLQHPDEFADEVAREVSDMLRKMPIISDVP